MFALLVTLPAGCTDDQPLVAQTPAELSDNGRLIEITMTDNSFEPRSLEAKVGETITLLFHNVGTVRHEAVVGDEAAQLAHVTEMEALTGTGQPSTTRAAQGVRRVAGNGRSVALGPVAKVHPGHDSPNVVSVEPGESGQITYSFAKRTELLVGCHEPGHYEDGMVATLLVE